MATSSNDDDANFACTPPEIRDAAKIASLDLLPERSRQNYEIAYNAFMKWRLNKNVSSFSEDTLLVYFKEISLKFKSSTLWTKYSMIRSILNIRHNVKIEKYGRLRAFLKRRSEGFLPKKSEVFTGEEINKFIEEAPDTQYLATKVSYLINKNECSLT